MSNVTFFTDNAEDQAVLKKHPEIESKEYAGFKVEVNVDLYDLDLNGFFRSLFIKYFPQYLLEDEIIKIEVSDGYSATASVEIVDGKPRYTVEASLPHRLILPVLISDYIRTYEVPKELEELKEYDNGIRQGLIRQMLERRENLMFFRSILLDSVNKPELLERYFFPLGKWKTLYHELLHGHFAKIYSDGKDYSMITTINDEAIIEEVNETFSAKYRLASITYNLRELSDSEKIELNHELVVETILQVFTDPTEQFKVFAYVYRTGFEELAIRLLEGRAEVIWHELRKKAQFDLQLRHEFQSGEDIVMGVMRYFDEFVVLPDTHTLEQVKALGEITPEKVDALLQGQIFKLMEKSHIKDLWEELKAKYGRKLVS